jgi:hypothetical protein
MDDTALGNPPPTAAEDPSPVHANAARLCRLALRNQDADGAFLTLLGALGELVRDEHGLAARASPRCSTKSSAKWPAGSNPRCTREDLGRARGRTLRQDGSRAMHGAWPMTVQRDAQRCQRAPPPLVLSFLGARASPRAAQILRSSRL